MNLKKNTILQIIRDLLKPNTIGELKHAIGELKHAIGELKDVIDVEEFERLTEEEREQIQKYRVSFFYFQIYKIIINMLDKKFKNLLLELFSDLDPHLDLHLDSHLDELLKNEEFLKLNFQTDNNEICKKLDTKNLKLRERLLKELKEKKGGEGDDDISCGNIFGNLASLFCKQDIQDIDDNKPSCEICYLEKTIELGDVVLLHDQINGQREHYFHIPCLKEWYSNHIVRDANNCIRCVTCLQGIPNNILNVDPAEIGVNRREWCVRPSPQVIIARVREPEFDLDGYIAYWSVLLAKVFIIIKILVVLQESLVGGNKKCNRKTRKARKARKTKKIRKTRKNNY